MYNRIGRAVFIVGRRFHRELCEKTTIDTIRCPASARAVIHCTPNSYVVRRSYCHNHSDESDDDSPELITNEAEGKAKLEEFLSKPGNDKIYKIIEMEIEVMRQNSEKVPDVLKPYHWAEILHLGSRNKRK